jgi:hypothetical protein
MEDWMEAWTKLHHHSYTVVAVLGLVATVVLASPGEQTLGLGPVRFDAFYAALAAFGALLVLSITGEYRRADYTLDRNGSEE